MNRDDKTRVLILDDNASDAELMRRELVKAGLDFTACVAQDEAAFLLALDQFAPDLILADYSLPSFDGMSALRQARESFYDIPVIIVSGAVGEETAIEAVKAGATDYVLKQRLTRLGVVVRRALQEAKLLAERRQAEEALAKNRSLLQGIIDNTQNLVYAFDLKERFLIANAALADLLGAAPAEIVGKKRDEFMPGATALQHEANDQLVIKAGKPLEFEEPGNFKGRPVTFLTTKFPLYDVRGDIYAVAGMSTDISTRKKSEEMLKRDKDGFERLVEERTRELIKAQIELEKAKRLSDIGVLAATVAHELRNPLAVIKVAAHNIKRKTNNSDIFTHLVNIDKKVAESDQIINNLLFYSRLRQPHCERIKIRDILEESIESIENKSKKNASIVRELDSLENTSVEADPTQIKEVFNNILNNADDAIPHERGRIRITAEDGDESIKVVIEDNGVGIRDDILNKVFDPFFSTKAKGTGLGLAVCRQIVNLHEGSICIQSRAGQGTSVAVSLPKERKKE